MDYPRFVVVLEASAVLDGGFVAALDAVPDEWIRDAQAYLATVRQWLRYDLEGAVPDAFSLLLEEVARRAKAREPFVRPPRSQC